MISSKQSISLPMVCTCTDSTSSVARRREVNEIIAKRQNRSATTLLALLSHDYGMINLTISGEMWLGILAYFSNDCTISTECDELEDGLVAIIECAESIRMAALDKSSLVALYNNPVHKKEG